MSSLNTQISTTIFLIFHILSCLTSVIKAQPQPSFLSRVCQTKLIWELYHQSCLQNKPRHSLISSIPSHSQIDYGFYNLSIGHASETVNGIILCRPDLSTDDCRKRLQDGVADIIQQCPNQKDAIGWSEERMIRYSIVTYLVRWSFALGITRRVWCLASKREGSIELLYFAC